MADRNKGIRKDHVKTVKGIAKSTGQSKKDTKDAIKLAKDRYPKRSW